MDWFLMFCHHCIKINLTWLWYSILYLPLDLICKCIVEDFCTYVYKARHVGPWLFYCWHFLLFGIGVKVMLALYNELIVFRFYFFTNLSCFFYALLKMGYWSICNNHCLLLSPVLSVFVPHILGLLFDSYLPVIMVSSCRNDHFIYKNVCNV